MAASYVPALIPLLQFYSLGRLYSREWSCEPKAGNYAASTDDRGGSVDEDDWCARKIVFERTLSCNRYQSWATNPYLYTRRRSIYCTVYGAQVENVRQAEPKRSYRFENGHRFFLQLSSQITCRNILRPSLLSWLICTNHSLRDFGTIVIYILLSTFLLNYPLHSLVYL